MFLERLRGNLDASCRWLEKPRSARRVVFLLLVTHSGLLAYSASVHSPNLNEPAHLVAGLSHWRFGQFELYRVNPPLVRMVAALPVMAAGYQEDWSGFYRAPGARPYFKMGEDFVAANGERSFFLFMVARWACIPFSWIGAIVCYLWARDLYGQPAGVVACSIWCFEPNILAHASLFTPDAQATALGLAACYTFWRWLIKPTWIQAALTGVALGLAELAKTTMILFYPLWPLMWLIYRWPDRRDMSARRWLREAGMLAARMVVGLYVLNLGYGFEGSLTRLRDYSFVSEMFVGGTSDEEQNGAGRSSTPGKQRARPTRRTNRFVNTWFGALPVPLPKDYVLGIDIQQRDFEHYARPSYLRGEWRDRGWWYYYLYACAVKVPLGLWLLGGVTLYLRFFCWKARVGSNCRAGDSPVSAGFAHENWRGSPAADHRRESTLARDEFILLFPAIVIFAVVSSKFGFSEHMRYVLPAFPFFFIAVSQSITLLLLSRQSPAPLQLDNALRNVNDAPRPRLEWTTALRKHSAASLSTVLVIFSLCWTIASSLWIYPHSISYFNESIGGPRNGPEHVLGSAVDWGQDLRYLKWCLDKKFNTQNVHVAYFGYFDPTRVEVRHSGVPSKVESEDDLNSLPPGIYAVSVNLLRGFPWLGWDAEGRRQNFAQNALAGFRDLAPTTCAGYSIYIFEIGDQHHSKRTNHSVNEEVAHRSSQ